MIKCNASSGIACGRCIEDGPTAAAECISKNAVVNNQGYNIIDEDSCHDSTQMAELGRITVDIMNRFVVLIQNVAPLKQAEISEDG